VTYNIVEKLLSEKNFTEVERLVANGYDINQLSSNGNTHLYYFFTSYEIAKFLFRMGANANAQSGHGHQAFIAVCGGDNAEHVRLYFEKGVDPNIKSGLDKTSALDRVIRGEKKKLYALFYDYQHLLNQEEMEKFKKIRINALYWC
jgi:ankyrin repeat protein